MTDRHQLQALGLLPDQPPPTPVALLPCPFCGGEPTTNSEDSAGRMVYWIQCRACAAQGPWFTVAGNAAKGWNQRVSPPTSGTVPAGPAKETP